MDADNIVRQPTWQRSILLSVICYEALGCLVGGSMLIASPDGKYMDMPVDIMHGTFSDFLIPGIILFGLGVLNTIAFFYVLRKGRTDWFMAGLGLGGLYIWFIVEIIILRELHWLHLMWGLPVLLGWIFLVPLIALRHDTLKMRKALLTCGIVSSIWYIIINIFVPFYYDGYSSVSLTVSELSAVNAPTRILWVLLASIYPLFIAALGWGILKSAGQRRSLKIMGSLTIAYSIFNLFWPPMHQREVISAGNGTLSDTMHIAWAMTTVVLMMMLMISGAAALGKRFRYFTIITFVIFIIFGILIGKETPGIEGGFPTPHIGLWERINIGAFMLWVIIFAFTLKRVRR
jgi:hypothetical protein